MKLSDEILYILSEASPDGNILTLNCGQLDMKLYRQVSDVLGSAGGTWSKKVQAFIFPPGVSAWEKVKDVTSREEVTTGREHKKSTQYFPTPPDVVEDLIAAAHLSGGHTVLEPSAGKGAIARLVAGRAAEVHCVELDAAYAGEIARDGYAASLAVADFLAMPPDRKYDRVIMNPPFAKGADMRHVLHALDFVQPPGRLVAVMSAGVTWREDKATLRFRSVVERAHGWWTELPEDAFKESGTKTRTVIVTIPVPVPGVRDGDEPAEVTTDLTTAGLPLFDPLTFQRGVYVHPDPGTGRGRVFRWAGDCVMCGRRTWRHDDRDDNPYGVFGGSTSFPVSDDDLDGRVDGGIPAGTEIPCCNDCYHPATQEAHEHLLDRAATFLAGREPGSREAAVLEADGPPGIAVQLSLFDTAA